MPHSPTSSRKAAASTAIGRGRALVVTPDAWRAVAGELAGRRMDAARPVGRRRRRAHGRCSTRPRARRRDVSASPARTGPFPRSARMHPPGDPARAADPRSLRARRRSARPTRGPGSITAAGTCSIRSAQTRNGRANSAYAFLPAEGEGLHQIPVGPVHAGIIEPGHFRFTANGETVVRLEERLGYVHKGIEGLMTGAPSRTRRGSPAAPPATARSPMRSPSRAPSRRRWASPAAPRAVAARADGGARAPRQSFRRYRRDLQRRVLRAHARPLRHSARTHPARRRRLLRPPADDGPHRAGGVAGDLAADGGVSRACALAETRRRPSPADRALRQHRLAAGPHRGTGMVSAATGAPVRRRRLCRPRLRPRLRRAQALAYPPYDQLDFEVPVLDDGRRQCTRLDSHPRGRAKPRADRADSGAAARRRHRGHRSRLSAGRAKGSRSSRDFAATCSLWLRLDEARDRALPSARSRPGSSGRCSRPRSRATSSPTSRSATNPSTAPIRDTISEAHVHAQTLFEGLARGPLTERPPPADDDRAGRTVAQASTAPRAGASAAACRSARSTPARATAASWKSMRSTTPSTTSSASACASSPRRAMPTCCW